MKTKTKVTLLLLSISLSSMVEILPSIKWASFLNESKRN